MTGDMLARNFIAQHLSAVEHRLRQAGVDDARGEAVTLVQLICAQHPTGKTEPLDALLETAVRQREASRSLARIAGFKHFHGMAMRLDDHVYEPCVSSERLLDHALAWVRDPAAPLRLLDLGTGAGNLLLAALKELPTATGVGVDRNPAAIVLARSNAAVHELDRRCEFIADDAHAIELIGFDVVLSTLPWIPTEHIDALRPEVRLYDPVDALDGGHDGLHHFRRLATSLRRMLTASGSAFLQIDYERVGKAQKLLQCADYTEIEILRDAYSFPIGLRVAR